MCDVQGGAPHRPGGREWTGGGQLPSLIPTGIPICRGSWCWGIKKKGLYYSYAVSATECKFARNAYMYKCLMIAIP